MPAIISSIIFQHLQTFVYCTKENPNKININNFKIMLNAAISKLTKIKPNIGITYQFTPKQNRFSDFYKLNYQFDTLFNSCFMSTILILFCLFSLAFSLSTQLHRSHNSQKHYTTNQCCKISGGKLCGRVSVDCCKHGCEKFWYGQFCKNNQKLDVKCQQKTCLSVCKAKGGVACGVSVSKGSVDCCEMQYCKEAQKEGSRTTAYYDQITDKIVDTLFDQTVGNLIPFHLQEQHNYFADTMLQKVWGLNKRCNLKNVIKLDKCLPDGFTDLLSARLNGGEQSNQSKHNESDSK